VGRALLERLKQTKPFPDRVQETATNLLLAAGWFEDRLGQGLAPFGLSHEQYNVLRILRGVHPHGHPRCEIAARLIMRAPDVTRLVDRLVRRRLVTRGRGSELDRRQSVARITTHGLALLERTEEAFLLAHRDMEARLGARECTELSRLCEKLWSGTEA
jgi:DNA-binding MarR family transcriptional regulator